MAAEWSVMQTLSQTMMKFEENFKYYLKDLGSMQKWMES